MAFAGSAEECAKLLGKESLGFWDVREEESRTLQLRAWNGTIKDCTTATRKALCVRVLAGGALGFASTDSTDQSSLTAAVRDAVRMARSLEKHITQKKVLWTGKAIKADVKSPCKVPHSSVPLEEKERLLLDQTRKEKSIESQQSNLTEQDKSILYLNSEGSRIKQALSYTHLSTSITIKGERVESFDTREAGLAGFEIAKRLPAKVQEAVDGAKLLLKAKTIKGGVMRVVTDPALTDVFVHEAVGHAAEADIVLQKDSYLEHELGSTLAPSFVTIVDSGTGGHWGSFFYDDEGIPAGKTAIIDKGVLRSFLHSRETAAHFGVAPTGNGRAQDARHLPQVRMRWTYLEPGDRTQDELVEEARDGVFLAGSKGGQVNTSKGSFQFSAQYGYRIRNGKLAEPVREVGLGGIAKHILSSIQAITKDMPGIFPGYCGKGGQSVPVGGPCPSVLIGKAMVGGKS